MLSFGQNDPETGMASKFLSFHLDLMHELAGPPNTPVRLEGISLIKVSFFDKCSRSTNVIKCLGNLRLTGHH